MYDCEHTIPVVIRNFLLCTDVEQDYRSVIIMCLHDIFIPSLQDPEYCRARMPQPLPASILGLVLKGANDSFSAIMDKFGWLLSWTSPRDTFCCLAVLRKFDMFLRPYSQISPLHQECRQSFVRSQSLTKGLLRAMRQGAQGLDDWASVSGTERSLGDAISLDVFAILSEIWSHGAVVMRQEPGPILGLVNAGFFETLDEILLAHNARRTHSEDEPRPASESTIFSPSSRSLPTSPIAFVCLTLQWTLDAAVIYPSILEAVRHQLPRPRTFRYLLEAAFVKNPHVQKCPPRYRPFSDDPDKLYARILRGSIETLRELEKLCRVGCEDQCGRRGCTDKTKARCSQCKTMGYCGADCQKW